MLINDHKLNHSFPNTLKKVYKDFQCQGQREKPNREVFLERDGLQFLGASTDLKSDFDYVRFRRSLEQLLQLQHFRMIQVVGDSGTAFDPPMLDRARMILSSFVHDGTIADSNTILEYGYTASKYDTNWIVNDLIATTPRLGTRTIGNVVHMSATAVEDWGSEATGLIKNFVLAFNDKETAFGSDAWLSDQVMDASCGDVLICLEGGPQAFSQAVTVCLNGVPVIAVTGQNTRAQPLQPTPPRFSAAHMLRILHDRWHQESPAIPGFATGPTPSLEETASEYLDNLKDLKSNDNRWKYDIIRTSLQTLLAKPEVLDFITVEYIGD